MLQFTLKNRQKTAIAKKIEAVAEQKNKELLQLKSFCNSTRASNKTFKAALKFAKQFEKGNIVVLETKEYRSKDGYTGSTDAIFPEKLEKGKFYLAETSNYWRGNSSRDRTQLFDHEGNTLFDRFEGDYLDHEEEWAGIDF